MKLSSKNIFLGMGYLLLLCVLSGCGGEAEGLLVAQDPSGAEGDVAQEESSSPNLLYMEFIPILTKAIQELEARLAALEA